MPGTGDGSSLQNAKEWDHSLYPGGTRVYDSFTNYYSGPNHWWALDLKGGVQYTFQTRLPTAFTTILYLYNESGGQIAYGYFNGDDASYLSKIVYTIPSWSRRTSKREPPVLTTRVETGAGTLSRT